MSDSEPGTAGKKGRTIGSINGGWGILFRWMLATYPIILAWGAWVTVEQIRDGEFRKAGDRWTSDQGMESRRRIEHLEEMQEGIEVRLDHIAIGVARIEARLNGTYKGPGP